MAFHFQRPGECSYRQMLRLRGPGTRLACARLMGVAFAARQCPPSLPAAIGWQVSV